MQPYQTRKIAFHELLKVDDWQIKVYTIAKTGDFSHPAFYEQVKAELPKWLALKNNFDDSHDRIGFLILHGGTEGIFSLVNWWVGTNMLNTHIFLTDPQQPDHFTKISGDGLAPCIWELEVINHERISWMYHVLKQVEPNYPAYLSDEYNGSM
ncbi:MAG: hypothetical protein AAF399_00040 [Bacteroidota bacterium]